MLKLLMSDAIDDIDGMDGTDDIHVDDIDDTCVKKKRHTIGL